MLAHKTLNELAFDRGLRPFGRRIYHAVIGPAVAIREHAADRVIALHVHAHRIRVPQFVADVEVDAFAHDEMAVVLDVHGLPDLAFHRHGASASRGTATLVEGARFSPR